jgi:asparagine synthase (glutamine-hydrolysing)
MCSISGIFSTFGAGEFRTAITRMNAALAHRGPDDQGVVECSASVLLGNTRLAVIDTSTAGHQPMNDPETGNWLTYNGETYNFKQLRQEIDNNPQAWRSNSDTEVVLRAYRKWGVDAFRRLRGMFALAIWDQQKSELLLARDPLGIKPLYYYRSEKLFVFASELRALLASGLVPRKLSSAGVDSYLATGSVEAPLTIVDGIQQLLPGQCLRVRATADGRVDIAVAKFGNTDWHRTLTNRADAVAQLRGELEEAVRLHLVSDVPLGVFLSGGMDSSALVALMSATGQTPRTFSVVFDEKNYTEAPHARAVAERFHTDHCEIHLDEDRLLEMLPEAITSLDQPTMDGINTFVVSKAVKNAGVTVALSGLGGDELFGGYPSFSRALRVQSMSPISRRLLRAVSGVGSVTLNGSTQRHKFWQLAASDCGPSDVYRITRQLFSPSSVTRITGRALCRPQNGMDLTADVVNAISQLELRGYMTNTLLRDTDAMSMAHSLEVRVPFVDIKVVEYALSLPGEWKLPPGNGHVPKPLLADALADLLPRDLLKRPKMGFTLPFEKWLQGRLRTEISAVLRGASQLDLATDAVGTIWHSFLQKPRAIGWSRPWSLYVLIKWAQINGVTPA